MFEVILSKFGATCGGVETALIDCSAGGTGGIWAVLRIVLDILTGGIGIAALIGISIFGIQYLTAGGNEQQIVKAKHRIFSLVIGLGCYVLMYVFLLWLLPNAGGFTTPTVNQVTISLAGDGEIISSTDDSAVSTVEVGSSIRPTIDIDGDDTTYSLYSSDRAVAAISGNSVQCLSEGESTITAVAVDGSEASAVIRCETANSYDSSDYRERLENLRHFNQLSGRWKNRSVGGCSRTIVKNGGCGLMSLYAGYYMFTGFDIDDDALFSNFIQKAYNDGYYTCSTTSFSHFGDGLRNLTGMEVTQLWEGSVNSGGYTDSLWDTFVADLKKGNKLLIAVRSVHGSVFTSGNHIMLIDHYDEEKDAMYLFDPSINSTKISRSGAVAATDDIKDGVYITRDMMKNYVRPWSVSSLSHTTS